MRNEKIKRRCKSCGKLLIDEKLFCWRCVLEGINKVRQVGIMFFVVTIVHSVVALINNNSDGENDTTA